MALKKFQFLNFEATPGLTFVQATNYFRNAPDKKILLKRALVQNVVYLSTGEARMGVGSLNINNSDGVNPADMSLYNPPMRPDVVLGQTDFTLSYFYGQNPRWVDLGIDIIGGITYGFDCYGFFPALAAGDFGYVYCTLDFEI